MSHDMRHEEVKLMNAQKLHGKIVERGMTIKSFARAMNMHEATVYRKFKKNSRRGFTVEEAIKVSEVLSLSKDDIMAIFFDQIVA